MHPSRSTAASWLISGIVHAGLLAMLLLTAPFGAARFPTPAIETSTSTHSLTQAVGLEPEPAETDPSSGAPVSPAEAGRDKSSEADASAADVSTYVRHQLEVATRKARSRTTPEQTLELEELAQRLTRLSSQESVEDVTRSLSTWLGAASDRATEPAAPADAPPAPFDVSTAQITEVLKSEDGEDATYVAVLVDAAGQTQQTPLNAAEGERLYEVFQLIKKFPLLETVYRRTVMSLLDQMLETPPADEAPSDSEQRLPDETPEQQAGEIEQ